jgi:probable HAF family extracellular repeat protein
MTDLGTLGGSSSSASSINNLGQIVGTSKDSSGRDRAFLIEDDSMLDLNNLVSDDSLESLGLSLTSAAYINQQGFIVGSGVLTNGSATGFLLMPTPTPVPLPATVFLLAPALGSAGFMFRRSSASKIRKET